MLCGGTAESAIGFYVIRPSGRPRCTTVGLDLYDFSETLLALARTHIQMDEMRCPLSHALTCLREIEQTLPEADVRFPRREAEVCARILNGISSTGIALELGIREETVMTYRKRIFHRLGIGSQRELLLWYLDVWGRRKRGERSQKETLRPPTGLFSRRSSPVSLN